MMTSTTIKVIPESPDFKDSERIIRLARSLNAWTWAWTDADDEGWHFEITVEGDGSTEFFDVTLALHDMARSVHVVTEDGSGLSWVSQES